MENMQLTNLVVQSAIRAAKQSRQVNLGDLWDRLMEIDVVKIQSKINNARSFGWYGAIPVLEPSSTITTSSAPPVPTIGIDGSQIYPFPENPVEFAFVQSVQFKSGGKPIFENEYLDQTEHQDEKGWFDFLPINSMRVDSLRTLLEVKNAQKATQESPDHVTILDNPIVPFDDYGALQIQWLNHYIAEIRVMNGSRVAGYISNPKSRLILNLLTISDDSGQLPPEYLHIDDSVLMRYVLMPGQRSALFLHGSRRNMMMEEAGTAVHFFYLKIDQEEIARVEIPEWVARDPEEVNIVQSSIIKDCQLLGYPYVLAMAHKCVAIPMTIGEELNKLALRVYMENGGHRRISRKLQIKGVK